MAESSSKGEAATVIAVNSQQSQPIAFLGTLTHDANTGIAGYFTNQSSNNQAIGIASRTEAGTAMKALNSGAMPAIEAVNDSAGKPLALKASVSSSSNDGAAAEFSNLSTSASADGLKVTTAQGNAVDISNSSSIATFYAANSGSGPVVAAHSTGSGALFRGTIGLASTVFEVRNNGEVRSDVGFNIPADFAEAIEVDGGRERYEPGDVLVVCSHRSRAVGLSTEPYSTRVAGVYSSKPGVTASMHPMDGLRNEEIPVAILGIVLCKVSAENGPIQPGHLLTTSATPGHAMRAAPRLVTTGSILGKALEPLLSGRGLIQILVLLQ
jgi:hypothetical protein